MGFKEAWKKFKDGIADIAEDLTTLDVVTITGKVDAAGTTPELDLKNVKASIEAAAKSKKEGGVVANTTLVAFTHIDFDADAVNFIGQDAPEDLVAKHAELVKASQEARASMLKFLAEAAGSLLP